MPWCVLLPRGTQGVWYGREHSKPSFNNNNKRHWSTENHESNRREKKTETGISVSQAGLACGLLSLLLLHNSLVTEAGFRTVPSGRAAKNHL